MHRSINHLATITLTVLAALAGLFAGGLGANAQDQAGRWQTLSPMPTVRSEVAGTQLGGKIYVAGGLTRVGVSRAFERYDPVSDAWDKMAPLPVGLHHTALAVIDGLIYMTGGFDGLDYRPRVKSAWVYDPRRNRWTVLPDMPAPRAAHRMVAIDGRLYLIGGMGPDALRLFVYDAVLRRWTKTAQQFVKRRHHLAAVAWRGGIYVIGGRFIRSTARVDVYRPATNTWRRLADLPQPVSSHTAAIIDGRIHVAGGEVVRARRTHREHWIYDPVGNQWWAAPPLPKGRHGMTSVVVNGDWYLIGGANQSGRYTLWTLTNTVERYTALR